MLVKIYGESRQAEARYSPCECLGTKIVRISGRPESKYISTNYAERANLTMRMGMRRFTGLTNGFSKKLANHHAAVAIHFMHCNFCRVHKTLRVTPAMQAGLSDHIRELSGWWPCWKPKKKRSSAPKKTREAHIASVPRFQPVTLPKIGV